MPKVAQYEPNQITTQITKQPLAQNAPSGAFGAPIVKGLLDITKAGIELKQRVDTTSAEEALVQFEREKNDIFFNPDSGYFNTQGKNAYDNSAIVTKSLEELKLKHSETLGSDARFMFNNAADKYITRSQVDISRHAAKGLKAWEVATIESQVENSIENASLFYSDPERLKVQNVLGRQAVIDSSEMMGIGPEATAEKLQTFESSFARASIEAAISSSADEGVIAMGDYGSRLEGQDKIKLNSVIEKKQKVEKTQADAQAAVLISRRLVDQYDSRGDIKKEIDKITDDDLRKKTITEAMIQFNRKKQIESEARGDAYENAEKFVSDGGSSEEFKVSNPGEWELMSPKQQKSIEKGSSSTDWNVFSDLMLLPKSELAQIDPTDYFDKLEKSERGKLISAVKSASGKGSSSDKIDHQVGRTRSAQTTSAVEQLFGKKSKWGNSDREKVNSFYSMLDDEIQFRESEKDARLTSEEFTNVLSGFTREVVQEGFFFDSKLDLNDIPADDIPTLSKFLRGNGVPVTSDNLIKAHKQASK